MQRVTCPCLVYVLVNLGMLMTPDIGRNSDSQPWNLNKHIFFNTTLWYFPVRSPINKLRYLLHILRRRRSSSGAKRTWNFDVHVLKHAFFLWIVTFYLSKIIPDSWIWYLAYTKHLYVKCSYVKCYRVICSIGENAITKNTYVTFYRKRSTFQNAWRQSSGTKCTWTSTSNVLKSTPFSMELNM